MTLEPQWRRQDWLSEKCVLAIGGVLALFMAALISAAGSADTQRPLAQADEALFQAIRQSRPDLIQRALSRGADINCRSTNGITPLLSLVRDANAALTSEQCDCLKLLLERKADCGARDADGRPPLIYAARLGDLASARALIEAGAYAKTRDRFHKTALLYAVDAHRRDIVDYLARNGDLQSLPYLDQKRNTP